MRIELDPDGKGEDAIRHRRARTNAQQPNHGVGPELDRVGKATLRRIVDKQIEAGVDIGNNGEQQREAFFLYVGIG